MMSKTKGSTVTGSNTLTSPSNMPGGSRERMRFFKKVEMEMKVRPCNLRKLAMWCIQHKIPSWLLCTFCMYLDRYYLISDSPPVSSDLMKIVCTLATAHWERTVKPCNVTTLIWKAYLQATSRNCIVVQVKQAVTYSWFLWVSWQWKRVQVCQSVYFQAPQRRMLSLKTGI